MKKCMIFVSLLFLTLCFSPALAFAATESADGSQASLENSVPTEEGIAQTEEPLLGEVLESTDQNAEQSQLDATASEVQVADSGLPESWIDTDPTEFINCTINGSVFKEDDSVVITGNFSDADGIKSIQVEVLCPFNYPAHGSDGILIREYPSGVPFPVIYRNFPKGGTFQVISFIVTDTKGYVTGFFDPTKISEDYMKEHWSLRNYDYFKTINLSGFSFEVPDMVNKDPNPPVYESTLINGTTFSTGDEVEVTGKFFDADGVISVTPVVKGPDGSRLYGTYGQYYGGQEKYLIRTTTPAGTYEIVGFTVQDKNPFFSYFFDTTKVDDSWIESSNILYRGETYQTIDLSGVSFEVLPLNCNDPNPPLFEKAFVTDKMVYSNEKPEITGKFSDVDGIKQITPIVNDPYGYLVEYDSYQYSGHYDVVGFYVIDKNGCTTYFFDTKKVDDNWINRTHPYINGPYKPIDLTDCFFEKDISVNRFHEDPIPPVFNGVSINDKIFTIGDIVKVNASFTDPDGIAEIQPILKSMPATTEGFFYYLGLGTNFEITVKFAPGLDEIVGFKVADGKAWASAYTTYFFDTSKVDDAWIRARFAPNPETTIGWTYKTISLPDTTFLLGDKNKEAVYEVLDGDEQFYDANTSEPLTVRFDGDLDDFFLVTIDGKVVPEEHYELISGSTIIKVSDEYINSLGPGKHEMVAWYKDGGNGIATFTVTGVKPVVAQPAEVEAEVVPAPESKDTLMNGNVVGEYLPATGDHNVIALLLTIALASFMCLMTGAFALKRAQK